MTARGHAAVSVPATSANLGPGFDGLAAALDLRLTLSLAEREQRRVVTVGQGSDELPDDDRNLVWRGVLAYCQRFGVAAPDVTLRSDNAIPLERGLGSSAAAAVAGLVLARLLTGAGGRDQDLIDLAAELEGHPDNAAAALLGGVVVCVDGHAMRSEPGRHLRPLVCIPARRQSTTAARGMLPGSVPLSDAAANAARAAAVLAGLSGASAWHPPAMFDVLHEPARLSAMGESGALVAALRAAGLGACLSGAGPSVLVIVARDDRDAEALVRRHAASGWDVRALRWHLGGAQAVFPGISDTRVR